MTSELVDPAGGTPISSRRVNRISPLSLVGLSVFGVIVIACLAAPLYAHLVAGTDPNANHLSDVITIDGRQLPVVSDLGIPIGPTWHAQFLLGADGNGLYIAFRLLDGGRTTLLIGVVAAALTVAFGALLGGLAGYHRGLVDAVISRFLDLLWAYPVVLLGIALGTALTLGGLKIGPLFIGGDSLVLPILVIGIVYIPYVARPIRSQVLLLRETDFIRAAKVLGKRNTSILATEVLPNILPAMIVFVPLLIANAILLEAGLSYLGAGVQAPNSSWGTMIASGVQVLISSPGQLFAPTVMLVATTVSLNFVGEGIRAAGAPSSLTMKG
ncbi:MAG: ABC transporter permease [Nakamurella sp.]